MENSHKVEFSQLLLVHIQAGKACVSMVFYPSIKIEKNKKTFLSYSLKLKSQQSREHRAARAAVLSVSRCSKKNKELVTEQSKKDFPPSLLAFSLSVFFILLFAQKH